MSNTESDDFGRFLENSNEFLSSKKVNLPIQPSSVYNASRFAAHNRVNVPSRAFQLPEPSSGSAPFRIRTRRPINLRLGPPPDSSAMSDNLRPDDNLEIRGLPKADEAVPNFRIFTREEVRNFKIPKPPSSLLSGRSDVTPENTTNNFTHNNALRWRLRGLRGDSASITNHRAPEESERFTLGSFKSSHAGSTDETGAEGITTGIQRALDSQYIRSRSKRRRQSVRNENLNGSKPSKVLDQLSEEGKAASGGSGDLGDVNLRISDEMADETDPEHQGAADVDTISLRSAIVPSRLSSASQGMNSDPLFVQERGNVSLDAAKARLDAEYAQRPELDSDTESARLRPRDPHEIEGPLIFDVPISEMPNIDWGADDVDVDGQFLEQQLEHSESESDEESDAGSVAEMIDDRSDDDTTYLNSSTEMEKEWGPDPAVEDTHAKVLSDDSSESDDDRVEALTESEGESDTNECVDPEADIVESVSAARRNRGKRNRIPTVKFWLGERIEYERSGKRELMTAVDVRRVEPPIKAYRKRRSYRPRRTVPTQLFDELEANADRKEVMVPVFDTASREWRDRTVARSISGLDFAPVLAEDGARMPMVTRCVLFGGKQDSAPLRLCVLRIEPGGVYSSAAEQNKACTFVVWRGKCTVHLNNHEFDLMKGMACLVPRGNDFFVDNGGGDRLSTGDVYLFITEVNAEANPELADAMARDAQSMISGATAISNFFESNIGSDRDSSANLTHSETLPRDNQKLSSSIAGDGFNAEEGFDGYDDNDSNETKETFGHGFARALRSTSEASNEVTRAPYAARQQSATSQVKLAHKIPPPGSMQSLSFALGSEKEILKPIKSSTLSNPPRTFSKTDQEFDTFDLLSDYLEGRKGNPRRLDLNERTITSRAEFRVKAYLHNLSRNQSNLSGDLN